MTKVPNAVKAYIRSVASKGGQGRARKLSAKRRQQIARKAARTRWAKRKRQT